MVSERYPSNKQRICCSFLNTTNNLQFMFLVSFFVYNNNTEPHMISCFRARMPKLQFLSIQSSLNHQQVLFLRAPYLDGLKDPIFQLFNCNGACIDVVVLWSQYQVEFLEIIIFTGVPLKILDNEACRLSIVSSIISILDVIYFSNDCYVYIYIYIYFVFYMSQRGPLFALFLHKIISGWLRLSV